jgi:beta-glucosidase
LKKRHAFAVGLLLTLVGCTDDATQVPAEKPDAGPDYVAMANATLDKMTLDGEITLVTGAGKPTGDNHNVAGFISAIQHDDLDIPGLFLNDGPNGVGNFGNVVTRFPTGISLGASWSRDAASRFGEALGSEWAGKGSNVGLGPGVNIDRVPYNGRTAEYFSEDPYLAGQIAATEVKAIQNQHVIATTKHYAVNNQETDRAGGNSIVSERVLREIYLPQFEAAVKEGGTGAIMCSYNKVGGTYACEHPHLLTEILRDDWGFTGFVMSDWGGMHSTVPAATAGCDMDMPGTLYPQNLFPAYYGDLLKAAVTNGELARDVLDGMVRRILVTMYRVGLFDNRLSVSDDVSTEAHKVVAESVSEEGTVLLQNRNATLPLAKSLKVAVIGGAADAYAQSTIGGSGAVAASEAVVTPLIGIQAAMGADNVAYSLGSYGAGLPPLMTSEVGDGHAGLSTAASDPGFDLVIRDASGAAQVTTTSPSVDRCSTNRCKLRWPAPYDDSQNRNWSAVFTSTLTVPTAQSYLFTLTGVGNTQLSADGSVKASISSPESAVTKTFRVDLTAGTHSVEVVLDTASYTWPPTYSIIDNDNPIVETPWVSLHWDPAGDPRPAALAAAAAADVAIVCVSDATTEGADHPITFPGDQDELVAAVAAVAKKTVVVLNTGGAMLLPWADQVDAIVENWYGGQRMGNAIAHVLVGDVNPSGKLPVTFPMTEDQLYARENRQFPGVVPPGGVHLDVNYDEELLVGYRWFDEKQLSPLFPFGHGLSYTTFGYENLRITPDHGDGDSVTVVAKITNTGGVAGKEVAELYVRFPDGLGEPPLQLKGFDKVALEPGESKDVTFVLDRRAFSYWKEPGGWTVAPGVYGIFVGTSSRDTALQGTFTVP